MDICEHKRLIFIKEVSTAVIGEFIYKWQKHFISNEEEKKRNEFHFSDLINLLLVLKYKV